MEKIGGDETWSSVNQLGERYDVHPATMWRWAKNDPSFPKPVTLSPGCTRWKMSEVKAWEARKTRGR